MFKLQVLIFPESYYLEKYSDSGETNSIGGTNPDSTDISTVATTTTNNNVFRYSTPDAAINNSMIFARPGSFNANSSFMFPPSYIQSQPYIQPASANKIKKFLHITTASNTLDAVAQEINLRFQRLYPSEEPLNILKIQNFEECDLDPDYVVSMVFDTSNICRVIVSNEFNDTPNANGKRFLNQDLNRVMKKRRLTNTNVGNTSIWNTTIDDNEFHMADHPGDRNKHLNKPLGMRVDSEPDVSSAIPGPEDTVIHPSKSPHLKIASPIIATGSPTRITSGMLNIQSQPDLSKVDYEEDTNVSIYIEQDPKRASVPSKEDRNNEKHNSSPFLSRLNNPDSSMIHESDISSSSIKSPTSQRSALKMPNQPPLEIVIPKEASAAAVVKGSKKQKITKDGSSSKKALSAKDDKASLDKEKEDKENDKAEKLALKVKEKAEKEKAVAEKAERLAKEKAEKAEKLAKERAEKAEKLAKEKAEKAERLAKEKAEKAEKLAKEKAEKAEKLAREKAEKAEKLAKEKAEKAEKLAKEKAEKEKIAKEKSDAAILLKEKAEKEKAAKKKDDEDDLAKEKAAKEKASKEKGAKERLEKEKAENAERERMKAIADDDAAAHRAKEHAAKMAQAIAERLSKSNTEKKANQEKSKGSEKSSVTEVPKNALKKSKTATKDLKIPESDIENEDDLKTIENLTREDTPDDEKLQNLAKPTKVKKLVVTPNQSTTVTESRETVFSKPAVLSQLSQKKISKVDNKAARAVEISGEIDESNILPPKPRGATILKEILTSDSSDSEVNSDDSSDDTSDDDQKSKPKVVTAPSNSKPRVVSQNNLSHSKEVILEPAKNIPLNPVTKPGPLVILSKSESSEPLSKRSTLPRLSAFIDKKLPEVRMQKQSQKSTAKPEVASDSDSDSDSESNSDSEGDSDSTSDSESASESDADVNASKFINSKTATQFVTTKKSKSKGKKNSGFSALMKDSKK